MSDLAVESLVESFISSFSLSCLSLPEGNGLNGYRKFQINFRNKSNLSEAERLIILTTNNRLNGCTYCMAAHKTISQMKGVSEDAVTALRENTPFADSKLEALRVFRRRLTQVAVGPKKATFKRFWQLATFRKPFWKSS